MDNDKFPEDGPLGRKKSENAGSTPHVHFETESSNAPSASFLTPVGHATENQLNESDVGNFQLDAPLGHKMRRLTTTNIFNNSGADTDKKQKQAGGESERGRLSMWGEQIHEKLKAKRDIKEVMKSRLKIHLKDEGSDAPQIFHTDINHIIEYDDEDQQDFVKSNFASDFVESPAFRIFILITIVINSIFIAVQTGKEMEKKFSYIFSAADQLILTVFICEILLKWYGGFFTYWKVGWNIFDFVIVASSLIGPSFTFISNSRVLRILRVLRAFRSLRSISALRPLQLVVQTIIQSLPDMANILLLLMIFMFVFAVIGVSLFANISPKYFGNLETTMFTLFICVTLDGWIEIFNTLRSESFAVASIYFVIFILIGAFILINLVVAVVVTNLESAIAEQDELELQQMAEEKGNQDDKEEPRVYDLRDSIDKKFWKHQKPIEVPNLPALNPQKVQNYMILVTAMEDNFSEMLFLKEELAKISKEVWDWNSPIDDSEEDDDDDDETKPSGPDGADGRNTKATKIIGEQENKQKTGDKDNRKSTFANMLSRASMMAGGPEPQPLVRGRRGRRSAPVLEGVAEENYSDDDDEDVEKQFQGMGKEKLHKKDEELPGYPSQSHIVSVDDDFDELYPNMPKPGKKASRAKSREERVIALRNRRDSLFNHIDERENKGDVLSDLISMNKKAHFSGKSQTMSQFVHGVDWLRSKQKSMGDKSDKKKKWQIESELPRERGGTCYEGVDLAGRTSVTSQSLVEQHLCYLSMARKEKQDGPLQEGVSKPELPKNSMCYDGVKHHLPGPQSKPDPIAEESESEDETELHSRTNLPRIDDH